MDTPPRREKVKFDFSDWEWGEKAESLMKQLCVEIADTIMEGANHVLDIWLTDYESEGDGWTRGDSFMIEVYVFDETDQHVLTSKKVSLTELVHKMELAPSEVAYRRDAFTHLAEELETLAKEIRGLLET